MPTKKSGNSLSTRKTKKVSRQNIVFVLFQGGGSNLKSWNEYTKSKFLNMLEKLGHVYTYQDKTYNIAYYNKNDPERLDFENNIDIDLSYVNIDTHIKMVHDDLIKKYNNLKNYKFVPVAWSAGSYLGLYFAQIYKTECKHVILLDPALWTPNNMKLRLHALKTDKSNPKFPITNRQYIKLLNDWKINNDNEEDMYRISMINHIIRSSFISKHLNLKLLVPTTAFVNINKPEGDEWSPDFNNKTRIEEVKILTKYNPGMYMPYILTNKGHFIFNKKQPATFIISKIKSIISS